jgi:Na+-driven multidrug efflux pump
MQTFATMNYPLLADALWVTGHVISALAVVVNHYHFYLGVTFGVTSQLLIIISRPIGRKKSDDS